MAHNPSPTSPEHSSEIPLAETPSQTSTQEVVETSPTQAPPKDALQDSPNTPAKKPLPKWLPWALATTGLVSTIVIGGVCILIGTAYYEFYGKYMSLGWHLQEVQSKLIQEEEENQDLEEENQALKEENQTLEDENQELSGESEKRIASEVKVLSLNGVLTSLEKEIHFLKEENQSLEDKNQELVNNFNDLDKNTKALESSLEDIESCAIYVDKAIDIPLMELFEDRSSISPSDALSIVGDVWQIVGALHAFSDGPCHQFQEIVQSALNESQSIDAQSNMTPADHSAPQPTAASASKSAAMNTTVQ